MSQLLPGPQAIPDTGLAAHAAKPEHATPTTVLVTEQQVAFGTAVALSVPPVTARRGWLNAMVVAAIRRIFTPLPAPRPHCPRREPSYMEAARMAREMDRL